MKKETKMKSPALSMTCMLALLLFTAFPSFAATTTTWTATGTGQISSVSFISSTDSSSYLINMILLNPVTSGKTYAVSLYNGTVLADKATAIASYDEDSSLPLFTYSITQYGTSTQPPLNSVNF